VRLGKELYRFDKTTILLERKRLAPASLSATTAATSNPKPDIQILMRVAVEANTFIIPAHHHREDGAAESAKKSQSLVLCMQLMLDGV
jgi:hypothetical protein